MPFTVPGFGNFPGAPNRLLARTSVICAIARLVPFICAAAFLSSASAQNIIVNTGDVLPASFENNGEPMGIAVDVLRAIENKEHLAFTFRFLPWPRAQLSTLAVQNELIIPLTRTPERETQYKWIAEIFHYHFVFVSIGAPPPTKLDELRHMRIGVLRASPAERLLREMQFTLVDAAQTEEDDARKLAHHRIDLWLAPDVSVKPMYRHVGENPDDVKMGLTLGDTMHIYVAASPKFDGSVAKVIARRIDKMKADGTIDSILLKYR